MSNIRVTVEGLNKINKPTIKYDTIQIELGSMVKFISKGVVVGHIKNLPYVHQGDTLTVTGLKGSFEVTLED